MKFIGKIMRGIESLEIGFRFIRSLEKGLKAFKAEFEGKKESEVTNEES